MTTKEHRTLPQGLRSPDAFTHRRCQILLASERRQRPSPIAKTLGCAVQTVRNPSGAFHGDGLACLREKSSRPKTPRPRLDRPGHVRLRDLLHQSPRHFGKPTSIGTLSLAAEVLHQQRLTPRRLSIEAIRLTLRRLGVRWRRAQPWITSPNPQYALKKMA